MSILEKLKENKLIVIPIAFVILLLIVALFVRFATLPGKPSPGDFEEVPVTAKAIQDISLYKTLWMDELNDDFKVDGEPAVFKDGDPIYGVFLTDVGENNKSEARWQLFMVGIPEPVKETQFYLAESGRNLFPLVDDGRRYLSPGDYEFRIVSTSYETLASKRFKITH
jgi:hypothetical protein